MMARADEVSSIPRRDIKFDLDDCDMNHWHKSGRHVSQFLNALSLVFPEGEKFFIDSVRFYRDDITDSNLVQDVKGFIGQEAMHSREHIAYNRALERCGLPANELERSFKKQLRLLRKWLPARIQLAITTAAEHFTALMADMTLGDERTLASKEERLSSLWRWHAIEETEHKAVAFDVYSTMFGRGPTAYFVRVCTMVFVTFYFLCLITYNHFRLCKAAGILFDFRGWVSYFSFEFVSPGPLRKMLPQYLSYFRPRFHPWDRDNRYQVQRWRTEYTATGEPPS
ncbi:metal-dependent hydrolase [Marinobacter sp. LN3S78]|uniref:metal-dependent hydrolase n=1 Tax=Marinobacter sp. LN3S78 TaxID=3382300 RepID=UPI00387AC262